MEGMAVSLFLHFLDVADMLYHARDGSTGLLQKQGTAVKTKFVFYCTHILVVW
jgi:hypothetical protein